MLSMYPACFYKEKDGGYSVLFPDFNGAGTCGDTFDEAMKMAIDFLAGYLYDLQHDKESFPDASEISTINPNDLYDEYESVIINMVTVDVEEYAKKHFDKPVKKTLSIPSWLNDKAMEQNINFSALLREALEKKLNI